MSRSSPPSWFGRQVHLFLFLSQGLEARQFTGLGRACRGAAVQTARRQASSPRPLRFPPTETPGPAPPPPAAVPPPAWPRPQAEPAPGAVAGEQAAGPHRGRRRQRYRRERGERRHRGRAEQGRKWPGLGPGGVWVGGVLAALAVCSLPTSRWASISSQHVQSPASGRCCPLPPLRDGLARPVCG